MSYNPFLPFNEVPESTKSVSISEIEYVTGKSSHQIFNIKTVKETIKTDIVLIEKNSDNTVIAQRHRTYLTTPQISKLARETLCFECPDVIQKKCRKLNNGGADCEKLFAEYIGGNEK
jgi:hypothetical protein